MKTKIMLVVISMLLGYITWLSTVTIPNKEKEIAWIEAKADSIKNLPPEIEYIKGDSVVYTVRDTVEVEVPGEPPVAIDDSTYTSAFNDGFIRGLIIAELQNSEVKSLRFNYSLITPLTSYTRVDTIRVKEYYPSLINRADFVNTRNDWMVLAGIDISHNGDEVLFAPGVDFITRSRRGFGYSYDIKQELHWFKVRLPLINKQ